MGSLANIFSGTKTVEEINSSINGRITVIKSLTYGFYIKVGGLTQSGGVVRDVWKSTIKKIKNKNLNIKNCLILGLGAGSVAKLVRRAWPDAKITGVEIDPIFVELGKKYLDLEKTEIEIEVGDAYEYVRRLKTVDRKQKFDLILIDIYVGDEIPSKFEKDSFVKQIKKVLNPSGLVVFNRLYYGLKRREAVKFGQLLEKNFDEVKVHYPEANVMFICRK